MWSPHNNLPLSLFLLSLLSPTIPQINNTNFLVCCFSPSQLPLQLLDNHDSEKQTTNVFFSFLHRTQILHTNLPWEQPCTTIIYNCWEIMKVENETLQMCGFFLLPENTNLAHKSPSEQPCINYIQLPEHHDHESESKIRRWLFPPRTTKHKTLANKPPSKSTSTKPLITSLLQKTNPRL
jgi:hypothetical protein